MYRNKRGAGDETWTLIWLVVGLLVLGFVAYAVISNWDTLSSKFNQFIGGKGTLSSAAEACSITCGKGEAGKTAWCGDTMDVRSLTLAQLQSLNPNIKDDASKVKFGAAELKSGDLIYIKDSTNTAVIPTGATARTVTSPDKLRVVVKGVSQSKQTADISGVTCGVLKETGLIQVDCALSC